MSKKKQKTVAIVGLGYVGLPLALLADKEGYKVIGIIRNPEKVAMINKKIMPFADNELKVQLKKSHINATTDFKEVAKADIVIICVPTPVKNNHKPDLGPLKSASKNVGKYLKRKQLVILESTVNPGVSDDVVIPILEKESKLLVNDDFLFSHCPERINPGDKKWNVKNIDRVIGGSGVVAISKTVNFYKSIIVGSLSKMNSLKEAEAVKIIENSFRDVNIAFVNELAQSFSKLGIDVLNVINGASSKPFAFMAHYPGCGVGGHCIPVDPYYLIEYAKKSGYTHRFLSLARKINNQMPEFTTQLLSESLRKIKKSLKGSKITLLGISYKPNIDDYRESPSFEILKILKKKGVTTKTFDPYLPEFSSSKSLEDSLRGSSAVIIATAHDEFKKITPKYLIKHGIKLVIDGRNCLDKKAFVNSTIIYKGIGR